MHARLLLLWLIAIGFKANGQPYIFKHLSVNDGLSQTVNNCIYRDSRGFVWISSFDGLNRFDGLACSVFRSGQPQSTGLKGTLFLNIVEDKESNVWIGSNSGLNMYNRKQNRFYNFAIPQRKKELFYSPVFVDEEQNVWVQSGHEFFRFQVSDSSFHKMELPFTSGNLLIKRMPGKAFGQRQSFYIIHQNRPVLYKLSYQQGSVSLDSTVLLNLQSPVTSILVNQENNAWIGTKNGLYSWQNKTLTLIAGTEAMQINALQTDRHGKLYAGTFSNGLLSIDSSQKKLLQQQVYSAFDNNGMSGNQVQYMSIDSMQNLWIAIWGKGIDYTNLARFRFGHYISKEQANLHQTDNFIKSMVQVGNHTWCSTQSGGIVIIDSSQAIQHVIHLKGPSGIEQLCKVGNEVWVASNSGFYTINISNNSVNGPFGPAVQFNFIENIGKDEVLLSSNAGLFITGKQHQQIVPLKGATSEVYLSIYKTKGDQLYIGRPFKGFGLYQLNGDSIQLMQSFPLEATVKCFYESNDSTLWIGSTQGLIEFSTRRLIIKQIFTTANGLSNQYIYGIVPDGNNLWLSSNLGLNRFNLPGRTVRTFSVNDGLQSNEFNTYAFGKTSSGIIQFGGINGLNAFDPKQITDYGNPPQLQLTSLQLNDNENYIWTNPSELDKLELNYDQNTISFQFTVLQYDDPAANSIRYKLEGYDENWIQAANKSLIRYARLPAGRYRLLVKAFNAGGQASEQAYELPVLIQTPWWQRWWFRTLLVIAGLALVFLLVNGYTRRKLQGQRRMLEKELAIEQERTRVARDLHDGLGGMLSGVKHAVAALQHQTGHISHDTQLFSKTLAMLDESILELRRVAYSMTPPSLSQFGLDHALRDYCSSVSGTEGLLVRYQSLGMEQVTLPESKSLNIYRIVQELVNNIIKHASATEALVQLTAIDNKLSITVEDNGTGFDKRKLDESKGMGWRNIRNRVLSLPGNYDLQTSAGYGSSIFIEMDLR